jgi:hypothetical protein
MIMDATVSASRKPGSGYAAPDAWRASEARGLSVARVNGGRGVGQVAVDLHRADGRGAWLGAWELLAVITQATKAHFAPWRKE